MKGIISVAFGLMLVSCDRNEKSKSGASTFDGLIGKKIDILIKDYGSPDQIAPSNVYSRKFEESPDAVVLTYLKEGKLVYVAKDCVVIGVFPIVPGWTTNPK